MRVLVTNDDGLHAPGLRALATAARDAGLDVLAVAPEGNYSGSGASIGDLGERSVIRCRDMPLDGLDEVESIEFDAPPALCVIATCLGAFGEVPDLVMSGVNPGLNTGRSTLHSGTVGAVLTAANFRLSGVAVSIAGHEHEIRHWDVAAGFAVACAGWLRAVPDVVTLNLSVPDRPRPDLEAPAVGSLSKLGAVHTEVMRRTPEHIELGFRATEEQPPEGSDSRLVASGHPVITPIVGIREAPLPGAEELLGSLAAGTSASAHRGAD